MTPPEAPIRLAVADDQALVRMGVRMLVEDEPDIDLVAEAADGAAAVAAVRRWRPDVVLMDIRMPVLDGIEALRRIVAEAPATRVVMLTSFDLDDHVFDALRAGASGFLLKSAEPDEMLRAVRVVAAGESLLSPAVTRRVIARFAGRPGPPGEARVRLSALTEREREVVGWVAAGLSNDEIAGRLVVSAATVRTHVGRAMTKLGARDRAQLVVFAYQGGLPIPEG
ncbi:response regulator transcription factor [Microbispora hainanensis]|uniref:Response regulator transcription factor n=1 Tax=Microbispora hainanensis TaxID=568844 RepID=A0ABZ1T1J9_9ACTN|nr:MULTISPECIES: response regulator transcription factor [Microbispora]NJP25184.1 response regulator transcription factor [Microbispora sp. CL1-1]TQS14079.1 response regulator transcription factor [Microbispora sp. SCL1-1]